MPLNTQITSILGTKRADFRKYKILKSNELTIEPSLERRPLERIWIMFTIY